MKRLFLFPANTIKAAALLFYLLISCNNESNTDTAAGDTTTNNSTINANNTNQQAEATLSGTKTDTTVTGTALFTQQQDGHVKMMLQITVPTKANQSVAVHIHEHGDCGDNANHAGGHWNPTNTQHGQWGQGSFHSGDIGNISLDGEGRAEKEITSDLWSIGGDAQKDILNKTVVIHSGTDDYTSQPAGNSGSRIGCGVIQRRS